ncbi:pentapeptide repeat-containing protein [Phormidium tenue FACHB-886]|nr:pentapeptide repeat-containing protein [Phormidium tenue FACHB-886]
MRKASVYLNFKTWIISIIFAVVFLTYLLVTIQHCSLEWAKWAGVGEDKLITISREQSASGEVTKITTTETAQSAKTLWDWLNTLIIPVSLAGLGFWFQQIQYEQSQRQQLLEREIAASNLNEDVLQTYLDRLSELLFSKALYQLKPEDPQREAALDIVRARTLSVLRRLDGERKGSVVRFLFDAEFITKLRLNLEGADFCSTVLCGADLRNAKLTDVNFTNADLRGANLEGSDLAESNLAAADLSTAPRHDRFGINLFIQSHTNLRTANLIFANLQNADLSNADLTGANLTGTNLAGANLYNTNLTNVQAITIEQVQAAINWKSAIYDPEFSKQLGLPVQSNFPKTFTDFVRAELQATPNLRRNKRHRKR